MVCSIGLLSHKIRLSRGRLNGYGEVLMHPKNNKGPTDVALSELNVYDYDAYRMSLLFPGLDTFRYDTTVSVWFHIRHKWHT